MTKQSLLNIASAIVGTNYWHDADLDVAAQHRRPEFRFPPKEGGSGGKTFNAAPTSIFLGKDTKAFSKQGKGHLRQCVLFKGRALALPAPRASEERLTDLAAAAAAGLPS